MSKPLRLALVGATGQLGEALLEQLGESDLVIESLHLLASDVSAGRRLECASHYHQVTDLAEFDFAKAEVAIFAVPASVSAIYVPKAQKAGCRVLDVSGHFLTDLSLPLLHQRAVPIMKAGDLWAVPGAIALLAAAALQAAADDDLLTSVRLVAMLPASFAGKGGVDELAAQTAALLNAQQPACDVFADRLSFQVQLAGTSKQGSSHSAVTQSAILTLKRLFGLELPIDCQVFYVPVFHGITLSVFAGFAQTIDSLQVEQWLEEAAIQPLGDKDSDQARAVLPSTDKGVVFGQIQPNVTRSDEEGGLWLAADNVTFMANFIIKKLEVLIIS